MQLQKTKRLYETKSEKEKSKIHDEERKKKLQELYRKQRKQLMSGATSSKQPASGNLFSISLKNEEAKQSNHHHSNEQDMSKVLLDKITYLLNDNDKLVDKQMKQMSSKASSNNAASSNKNHKFVSKRINNASTATKRVEFEPDLMETNEFETNNNSNKMVESSFDYSSSSSAATLTPNSSNHISGKYHNQEEESLVASHHNSNHHALYKSESTNHSNNNSNMYKHDRLKKICSMALDLQTKLQQTKLKLFGFNPNDDSFNFTTNVSGSNNYNSNVNANSSNEKSNNNIDEIFSDSKEKMIMLESMFKSNIKEERTRLANKMNSNKMAYLNSDVSVNSSHASALVS
jgi:hypothetical protein